MLYPNGFLGNRLQPAQMPGMAAIPLGLGLALALGLKADPSARRS